MKENTENRELKGYLEDLQGVYKGLLTRRTKLETDFKSISGNISALAEKYGHEYAQTVLAEANQEYENGLRNLVKEFDTGVGAVREKFQTRLSDIYTAAPGKLDADTMQLLNTGICNVDELAKLAELHRSSPTMLRVIKSYADKLAGDSLSSMWTEENKKANSLSNRIKEIVNGEEKRALDIFDGLSEVAKRATHKMYGVVQGFESRWDEFYSAACDGMDELDHYSE